MAAQQGLSLPSTPTPQQGLSLLSTPTPSSEEGSNVLFKQIPSALARTPQLISRAVELARRRNSSESPKEEAGLVPSLRSQRQNSTEDLAAVPVDEIAQPDSTEGAEGSTLAAVSNLNSDYSPQDKTSDSSGNVDPLRDRALRTVPSTTTGLPRVGVGACPSFHCLEHFKDTARERGETQRDRETETKAHPPITLYHFKAERGGFHPVS